MQFYDSRKLNQEFVKKSKKEGKEAKGVKKIYFLVKKKDKIMNECDSVQLLRMIGVE